MSKWRDSFAPRVVDAVLEDVRFGLESNRARAHQRRCATMRLLGELHRAKIVTTSVVFAQLYLLISFGHDEREATVEGEEARETSSLHAIDPPSDTIRVRLVCALLETCGRLFDRGPPRKFLDRFLVFFQQLVSPKTRRWTSPKTSPTCSPSSDPTRPHETTTPAAANARASRLTRRAPREADGSTRISWTRSSRKRKRRTRWTVRRRRRQRERRRGDEDDDEKSPDRLFVEI